MSVQLFRFALLVAVGMGAMSASPGKAIAQGNAAPNTAKIDAYVACINRLSERSHDSRRRYFSWVGKQGPTGKERIIYGLYTIYDTKDCKNGVEKANALEPRDEALEAAANAYVLAVTTLEPLLQEADDYYSQENYKDDRMAKGKALHPQLVAAWRAFASADETLRLAVDVIQEKHSERRIAHLAASEGKSANYYAETLMLTAKRLLRHLNVAEPSMKMIGPSLANYEEQVKGAEAYLKENKQPRFGLFFMNTAKKYLESSKKLMRRVRDKVPYSTGDQMLLRSGGGAWMVEGSPARVLRDYNEFVQSYNRGYRF